MSYWAIPITLCLLISCHGQNRKETPAAKTTSQFLGENNLPENEGIVFFSDDDGSTWTNHSKGIPGEVFLTDIASSDGLLGISTKQQGLFLFDFSSDRWEPLPNSKPSSRNIDALCFFENKIFAGTQGEGVFVSENKGRSWKQINKGLEDHTIRKLVEIRGRLFAGTNGGLFSFGEETKAWGKEFGSNTLQVNGITCYNNQIYIGTNQGAFKASMDQNNWESIFPDRSLHNISAANGTIYAMVYNELFASKDEGANWQSDQYGMPEGFYSFQVVALGNTVLVGQWDGIYKKDKLSNWIKWNVGLPEKIPVTEMRRFDQTLVSASSQWVHL